LELPSVYVVDSQDRIVKETRVAYLPRPLESGQHSSRGLLGEADALDRIARDASP